MTAVEGLGWYHPPDSTTAAALCDDSNSTLPYVYSAPSSASTSNPLLNDIPLLEYLNSELKPAFIIDTHDHNVAYENSSFVQWRSFRVNGIQRSDGIGFQDWIQNLARDSLNANHTYGGRAWTVVQLAQRWMVVSSQVQDNSATRLQTSVSRLANRARSSQSSPSPDGPNKRRFSATTSSSWATVSDAGQDHQLPKLLDWTRFNVPGISAHAQFVKDFPWHNTPIGSIDTWSDDLRQAVTAIMVNPEARAIQWGPENNLIYNEACAVLYGKKHPRAMGMKFQDIWVEAWDMFEEIFLLAETQGKATRIPCLPLIVNRYGYEEETFWKLNLVPIIGADGFAVGSINEFSEVTREVITERRQELMRRTSDILSKVTAIQDLWQKTLQALQEFTQDIPYAILYTQSQDDQDTSARTKSSARYTLNGTVGIDPFTLPQDFDMSSPETGRQDVASICREASQRLKPSDFSSRDSSLPSELAVAIPDRGSDQVVRNANVIPIFDALGRSQLAFIIIGLTAGRPFDSEAFTLANHISDLLAKIVSVVSLPEEQRKLQLYLEEVQSSLSRQLTASNAEAERMEARFTRIFDSAPVGMYAISTEAKHVYFNKAYLSMTGIPRDVAKSGSRGPSEYVHEDDVDRVTRHWFKCLEDKLPFTIEYRVKKEWHSTDPVAGTPIVGEAWIATTSSPELDEHGNVLYIMGWTMDISDRKHQEKLDAVQQDSEMAEARFKRLAESAPLGMYLLKPDGSPIYLNDAYFDILGFTREDFEEADELGVGWADQILEEDVPKVAEAWKNLSEYGVPLNLEYRVKKPWRSYDSASKIEMTGPTWLQGTAVAERDEEGKPVAVQGWVTEISLKKFSERLLAERLEEALATKQQADRFIDMTSHEMRNPLSAILQSADGILTALGIQHPNKQPTERTMSISGDSWETVVDSAQTIILCAQHQKRIVDDILTLSKLDSNLLVISPDKTVLPNLIEKCFKMYEAELDRADMAAVLQVEQSYTDLSVHNVMLDSSRLLQVVINLLTNAIKFTQHADKRKITIYLGASLTRPSGENHRASFIEQRPNRSDPTTRDEWGTGDEVYLTIAVEDTGRGLTEEELKLLFHRFSQASPKTYKQYGGSGLGLFISRELTELQGGQIGVHSVAGVGSTFTFYVKVRRHVAKNPAHALYSTSPATLARKGSSVSTDSSASSFQLPQPQSRRASTIARRKSVSLQQQVARTELTDLHVLVVEDNVINQRVMATQLRRLGAIVHVANHGVECLEFLHKTTYWKTNADDRNGDSEMGNTVSRIPLSVVLMDVEMPVLGGLECVKQIRELQSSGEIITHVPVIAITANARNEQITAALAHGMDSVVTKPFRIPDLVPKMEELMSRLEAARV